MIRRRELVSHIADDPELDEVFAAIQQWKRANVCDAPFDVRDRLWRRVVRSIIELKYPTPDGGTV